MNRNNENYTFLFVTLGLLTAFGPFVTDFYLPALPALADYFRSSASMAQMSLTTGMFGLAVGQVFIGPISDRYGRRMPLLVSMAAFIVATALCIVVPNIYLFNLLRLFQRGPNRRRHQMVFGHDFTDFDIVVGHKTKIAVG